MNIFNFCNYKKQFNTDDGSVCASMRNSELCDN